MAVMLPAVSCLDGLMMSAHMQEHYSFSNNSQSCVPSLLRIMPP